jgi:hypothetical protein
MDRNDFNFITPKSLRMNVVESVKFATFLWILAQKIEREFQDETLRTVILYNIAVIEALLLFRIKKEKISFSDPEYKYVTALPNSYKINGADLIVAHRVMKVRGESRIWLYEMIKKQEKFLGKNLSEEITDLQNIRNTFHLSRKRASLSFEKAESSFDTVLKVVNKLRK